MTETFEPGRLSPHFFRSEFACHCGCGLAVADAELIRVLEDLREAFGGRKTRITSGCRCAAHNARIGGAPASKHLSGLAADIAIAGIDAAEVADYLEDRYPDCYGIGRYPGWTHIDVRPTKARW